MAEDGSVQRAVGRTFGQVPHAFHVVPPSEGFSGRARSAGGESGSRPTYVGLGGEQVRLRGSTFTRARVVHARVVPRTPSPAPVGAGTDHGDPSVAFGDQDMAQLKLRSLAAVTVDEARAYLEASRNDEIVAAIAVAVDRNVLAGTEGQPDAQDVHHALFLLRRAQGLGAPSFDDVRAALKTHRDQVRDVAA